MGGVENYFFSHLRPRRQTTSPLLPSTIHHSILQSIEIQWFLVDVPGDDGSLPTLSHSNSVLCHSVLRSAKPSARREEAHTRLTQLLPFLGSPPQPNLFLCHDFLLFPASSLLLPRLFLFLLFPLPYPLQSCITAECIRDYQDSVFLLLGRRRFQRALAGVYLKTDPTIREERERRPAMLRVFFDRGTLGNVLRMDIN